MYSYRGDAAVFATRIKIKKDQQLKCHNQVCIVKTDTVVVLQESSVFRGKSDLRYESVMRVLIPVLSLAGAAASLTMPLADLRMSVLLDKFRGHMLVQRTLDRPLSLDSLIVLKGLGGYWLNPFYSIEIEKAVST